MSALEWIMVEKKEWIDKDHWSTNSGVNMNERHVLVLVFEGHCYAWQYESFFFINLIPENVKFVDISCCAVNSKGVPARESRTGTRLVSPATGCKKKKGHLRNRASEHQIKYIRTYN